jgi:CRP-like cAMP-binding protein
VLERCNGFGEIALLKDVPRVADVAALTPGKLYALAKPDFVSAVTGHPAAAAEGERLVRERMPAEATMAP